MRSFRSVSVIIPTLNEERRIESLLNRLTTQTVPVHQIIVVDAGSTDGTECIVRGFRGVRFIRHGPPVGAQRTAGGRQASGDVLFFLDADTVPDPDFIERSMNEFAHRHAHYACVEQVPYDGSWRVKKFFRFLHGLFIATQRFGPGGGGPCIIMKRTVFMVTGGFDGKFLFDDAEFLRRAHRVHRYDFRVLPVRLGVSARRFKTDGEFRTIARYMLLAVLFSLNQYGLANRMQYGFGKHSEHER